LLTLSDRVAHFGLEHHQSNDSRVAERALIDEMQGRLARGVLPHEYVHSWNGKYRRPAGLTTPNPQTPMQGDQETARKQVEMGFSLGLRLNTDGLITDVIPDMPAARAKLGPRHDRGRCGR
jgi:predicted metalloprotease with PDZ domain